MLSGPIAKFPPAANDKSGWQLLTLNHTLGANLAMSQPVQSIYFHPIDNLSML